MKNPLEIETSKMSALTPARDAHATRAATPESKAGSAGESEKTATLESEALSVAESRTGAATKEVPDIRRTSTPKPAREGEPGAQKTIPPLDTPKPTGNRSEVASVFIAAPESKAPATVEVLKPKPVLPLASDKADGLEFRNAALPEPGKTQPQRRGEVSTRKPGKTSALSKRDEMMVHLFQERCRQLNISLFFQENTSVRSLGFTSAIHGEGKSLLSVATANLLANDSNTPVTLIECNWEHPSIHEYYNVPARPGIAEWLRRECKAEDIRHQVHRNLTVIPGGNGRKDALKLLAQMRQLGLEQMFATRNDLLVVDLPPIATTAYGQVAASLLDAVILVVHAGVTPDIVVSEACEKLKNVAVQGVVLNQFQSHIPRWLRQML